jgi:hypothetical protein
VKLGEYAREWLESKHKLKPSTRARYQVVLDTVVAERANIALGDISRQLVRVGRRSERRSGPGVGPQDRWCLAPGARDGRCRAV